MFYIQQAVINKWVNLLVVLQNVANTEKYC